MMRVDNEQPISGDDLRSLTNNTYTNHPKGELNSSQEHTLSNRPFNA